VKEMVAERTVLHRKTQPCIRIEVGCTNDR
jgi:hypothetical protein